jgi:hypothetical protein
VLECVFERFEDLLLPVAESAGEPLREELELHDVEAAIATDVDVDATVASAAIHRIGAGPEISVLFNEECFDNTVELRLIGQSVPVQLGRRFPRNVVPARARGPGALGSGDDLPTASKMRICLVSAALLSETATTHWTLNRGPPHCLAAL